MTKTFLGLNAKLYINDGDYESPDWELVENVKDLGLSSEKAEADTSTRASKWKTVKGSLREASVEFTMMYDTTDEMWQKFQAAYFDDEAIECAVMDGDIDEPGSEGLRASFEVMKWSHTQDLTGAQITEVSLKPARAENAPEWLVVPTPPSP